MYYEALDLARVALCIKTRFDQEDYRIILPAEVCCSLTVTGGDFSNEMDIIAQFYGSNFSRESPVHISRSCASITMEKVKQIA